MRRDWPPEVWALHASVDQALRALDGVELARRCEQDPARRREVLAPVLDRLGIRELNPWGDEEEAAAAALASRAAGRHLMPWPLTHELAVPPSSRPRIDACFLVSGEDGRLDHADLFERPVALSFPAFDGVREVRSAGPVDPVPLDPFGGPVTYGATEPGFDVAAAGMMHLVLDGFWVSGAMDSVVGLATQHARERYQFGRAIGHFGEIRTRLADMVVARDGLDELARYTWWAVRHGHATAVDALALRSAMIESTGTALRHGHQILGAMGLCEEHDLAVIDRHLQSVLRRPAGWLGTATALADAVARYGFAGPYPVPARAG